MISDFGGVLTTPLMRSFAAFQDETGVPPEALGVAMQRVAEADGKHPLFELERGRITEDAFLARLRGELASELGHEPQLHRFREIYFEALDPNEPMIELMRELRERGLKMALLTNNVREWEPLWRSMMPVDEVFELIVDSAFVGMRKPEPEIYELTLERLRDHEGLADLAPAECVFVDDIEVNVEAARSLGMRAVRFRSNQQAIPEIKAAVAEWRTWGRLVVAAGAVPDVELDGLDRELHLPRRREPLEHGVERPLLGDTAVNRLLAAKAGGELQRLASVLSERAEGSHQEVPVGHRVTDVERGVPGGEHRDVVLVELGDRPRVVRLELVVGDLVNPGPNRLPQQLAPGLPAHGIGDRTDRIGGVYEAERHHGRR